MKVSKNYENVFYKEKALEVSGDGECVQTSPTCLVTEATSMETSGDAAKIYCRHRS